MTSADKFFQNFQNIGVLTLFCYYIAFILVLVIKIHLLVDICPRSAHFKPKFDLHIICRLCRSCSRQWPCDICKFWPETYWQHIYSLEKSAISMGSHKGDSPVDTQTVKSSRKGVKSKVPRSHKGTSPVDSTSNTEGSGNESSESSSASEPESVARSHKGTSPVDPMSGRSSSHGDDSALGSRLPPPGNESPSGSSHSRQR